MIFNLTNQWKAKLSAIIIPRKQLWPTINFCSEDKRSITRRNPTAEWIFNSSPLRFSSSTSFYKNISVGYCGEPNTSKLHGMLLCIYLLSKHKISNSYLKCCFALYRTSSTKCEATGASKFMVWLLLSLIISIQPSDKISIQLDCWE